MVPIEHPVSQSLSVSSISLEAKEDAHRRSRESVGLGGPVATPRFPWLAEGTAISESEPVTRDSMPPSREPRPLQAPMLAHSNVLKGLGRMGNPGHATLDSTGLMNPYASFSSETSFSLRRGPHAFGSPFRRSTGPSTVGLQPSARPERARPPSKAPALNLECPRNRGSREATRSWEMPRDDFQVPLPAPRGPHGRAAEAAAQRRAMELAPRLRETSFEAQARASSSMPSRSVGEDEVNLQSPQRIPQPSKLLRSGDATRSGEMAVQTEVKEPEKLLADVETQCEAAVQTEHSESDMRSPEEAKFSSPMQSMPVRSLWVSDTPELQGHGLTQSTPDFGMELSFAPRLEDPRPAEGVRGREDLRPEGWADLPQSSKPRSGPVDEELKQRLQNALARGLSHVRRLQDLAS